jgi:LAO/AO transport system kinase
VTQAQASSELPVSDPQTESLAEGVLAGQRRALARAITLVESTRSDHRAVASALLQRLAPHAGNSVRLGISGVPGVGKSTFIEAFGIHVIDAGHRVAVLSIDPSSAISGGSILGDKTRMEELSRRSEAYIRPSPSGNTGLRRDPGRDGGRRPVGDESRGDDRHVPAAAAAGRRRRTAGHQARHHGARRPGAGQQGRRRPRGHRRPFRGRVPQRAAAAAPALRALEGAGAGEFDARRAAQARAWMWSEVNDSLVWALQGDPEVRRRIPELEAAVSEGRMPATLAARELLELFLKHHERWD